MIKFFRPDITEALGIYKTSIIYNGSQKIMLKFIYWNILKFLSGKIAKKYL
jgi:hypothetical protein